MVEITRRACHTEGLVVGSVWGLHRFANRSVLAKTGALLMWITGTKTGSLAPPLKGRKMSGVDSRRYIKRKVKACGDSTQGPVVSTANAILMQISLVRPTGWSAVMVQGWIWVISHITLMIDHQPRASVNKTLGKETARSAGQAPKISLIPEKQGRS